MSKKNCIGFHPHFCEIPITPHTKSIHPQRFLPFLPLESSFLEVDKFTLLLNLRVNGEQTNKLKKMQEIISWQICDLDDKPHRYGVNTKLGCEGW